MRIGIAVGLLAVAAVAEAKPLPKDMKVTFKKDTLYVTQGGVTVPLRDEASAAADQISDFKGAELSDDGSEVIVQVMSCSGGGGEDEGLHVPLAEVTARLENTRGMQLHLKKKYADAIVHFAAAAKADPDTPVYATNLLSAQSMAKLLDDADATLATYAPKHAAWFAWRLAVDKELANVRARPGAKALLPAKPGTLKIDPLGDAIAVAPSGIVAVREWVFVGGPGGADGGFDLTLYDPSPAGQDVAPVRLTGIPYSQACGGAEESCTKAELAKQAASKKKLDPVLAAMGFEKRPTVWVNPTSDDGKDLDVIETPDKSTVIKVIESDTGVTFDILRGKARTSAKLDERPKQVGFAGNLVILQFRENGFLACDGDSQRSYSKVIRVE